jgi:hypothetical protein
MALKALRNPSIVFIFSNLVVLIPFVGWLSVSPLLPPDEYMNAPRDLTFSLFMNSLIFGLTCSVIVNCLIGLPALNRLRETGKDSLKAYAQEIALWVGGWCCGIGILVSIFSAPTFIFTGAIILFIALSIPIYLAGLIYWSTTVRTEKKNWLTGVIVLLFALWNLEAALIAALSAAD